MLADRSEMMLQLFLLPENDHGKSPQHQKTATKRRGKAHQGSRVAGKLKIKTLWSERR